MKFKTHETPYTVPQICTANPKDWFIYFRFFHGGKWHSRKFREGINRIQSIKNRRKEAEGLREAREDWLKMGWNPVTDPEFKLRKIMSKTTASEMNFNEAVDFALSKKKLATKSARDYGNVLKHIKATATKSGFSTEAPRI